MRLANAIDWRGKSVLMHAASRDHAEMVALLVQHNARVEATDYTGGMTVSLTLTPTLTLTLTRTRTRTPDPDPDPDPEPGPSPNPNPNPKPNQALMLAARNGSLAAVEALVTAGANVNAATPHGTTTLMNAEP